ncbi:MAG TPA: hypothetical protein VLX61_04260 [Anaerolineales bacterium]|nr:hypothetical protein [Anaerolineales bacterium]
MPEAKSKTERLRSPAYPYFDLKEAIEKTQAFYNIETLNRIAADLSTQDIGYEKGSNRGWRALSTIISFGLLDEEGLKEDRKVWLSELGKEILHYKESEETLRVALRKAALKPAIHAELWEAWSKSGQLPSEPQMRRHLEQVKLFNPKAVDPFIREFLDTLTFAGFIKDGKIVSSNDVSEGRNANSGTLRNRTNTGERMSNSNLQEYPIPLLGGSTAILSIPRPLSKQNLDLIKSFLTMYEPSLTEGSNAPVGKEDEDSKNDE